LKKDRRFGGTGEVGFQSYHFSRNREKFPARFCALCFFSFLWRQRLSHNAQNWWHPRDWIFEMSFSRNREKFPARECALCTFLTRDGKRAKRANARRELFAVSGNRNSENRKSVGAPKPAADFLNPLGKKLEKKKVHKHTFRGFVQAEQNAQSREIQFSYGNYAEEFSYENEFRASAHFALLRQKRKKWLCGVWRFRFLMIRQFEKDRRSGGTGEVGFQPYNFSRNREKFPARVCALCFFSFLWRQKACT
jgi:hypothetical protein